MKVPAILAIVVLLIIAALPWGMQSMFSPLQSPALIETPTAYAPTEAAYLTREAVQPTSFLITLPPLETATLAGQSQALRVAYVAAQDATATATIPLPVARNPTSTPMAIRVELTESEAIDRAQSDFPELRNPNIDITEEEVRITGLVGGTGPIGQGITIVGALRLDFEEMKIVIDVTYVELNGRDITAEENGQQAARAANNWLRSLQVGQEVLTMQVQDGVVLYDALQYQGANIPTQSPTPDPMTQTAIFLTGTPTSQFFIRPDETSTPIPTIAATEVAALQVPETPIPLPEVIVIGPVVGIPGATATTPSNVTNPTATIQPPVARTPTQSPQPTQSPAEPAVIDDSELGVISALGPLTNVSIEFVEDGLVVTGTLRTRNPIIPGASPSTDVRMEVGLTAQDGRLVPSIDRMFIGGQEVPTDTLGGALGQALGLFLNGLAGNDRVDGFALDEGLLSLNPPTP